MNNLKIASRNIFRNVRRSFMTILAIAVGAISMLLFGEFVFRVFAQLETRGVTSAGHIAIYKRGYFKYGVGDPSAYGIPNYQKVMDLISNDPMLKDKINVITPTISMYGIAGNFEKEASKTFFGRGVVPEDYNKMLLWDEHELKEFDAEASRMNPKGQNHGNLGVGIGQILKLCKELNLADCPSLEEEAKPQNDQKVTHRDFGNLDDADEKSKREHADTGARLDLLAATSAGAPNVVNFYADKAVSQGFKELDDAFVLMNFDLAQQLLYGRGEKRAVGITLQLHHTADIQFVRAKLEEMFKEQGLKLEVRDLKELQPFYKQAVGMFSAIFSFISLIMVIIVLFTVVNTMSMSVMERTQEIGTLRALGVKRRGITSQFVTEGALLGFIGASSGMIIGFILSQIVNGAGLTWQPPGSAAPVPLKLMDHGNGTLLLLIWLVLTLMATVAAWIPARRAAKMNVVDALGHV
jgi:putative ABC transport system permease protein